MADEPGKQRKLPPNLPPLPGGAKPSLPPPLPSGVPALPSSRSGPPPKLPLPPMSGGSGGPKLPAAPWSQPAASAPAAAPAAPVIPAAPAVAPAQDAERKIAELEHKLQQEREKVLLANLKASEEAAVAARVETSIKEVQEKLRRDRRDAEREENRLKLEAKISELENRLVSERETWVATLKNQVAGRETQDKEIESHFTGRIQEMERRWLEEKAHWQRVILNKEEEIRNAKSLAEKLKGIELEHRGLQQEKRFLDERVNHLAQENASLAAKVSGSTERERDYFQLKAELDKSRDQLRTLQDRFDRETEGLRRSAKEREERLLADNERLQQDLAGAAQRFQRELEVEARRIKTEADSEVEKARASAELAGAALQRMRAVGSALERQVAALRVQAEESRKLKDEVNRVNERYKAEFMVLQRKWHDRETEIRRTAKEEAAKQMEAEKGKIRLRAQQEIQDRLARAQDQIRRELEVSLRAEAERAVSDRQRRLAAEIEEAKAKVETELRRKQEELDKRDAAWQDRLLRKESELISMRSTLEEARARLGKEDERTAASSKDRLEAEKKALTSEAEASMLRKALAEVNEKLVGDERAAQLLMQERRTLDSLRIAAEEKARRSAAEAEELKARLAARERAEAEGGGAGPGLQRELADAKAEVAKVEEAWRQKLEVLRRDLEARVKALQAENENLLRGGRGPAA